MAGPLLDALLPRLQPSSRREKGTEDARIDVRLAIVWWRRSSPWSVERSVACSSLADRERIGHSACTCGVIRPDVTSTSRFAARDEGHGPALIRLLMGSRGTLKYPTLLRRAVMAEKKSRAAARKIKDKWKAKVWYNLLAPEMFNKQALGETPTDDPGKLVGRVTEVTVQDLTGDFSKMHIKLQFRVNQVQGQDALTQFVGHDMTSDYIRRLTRRKRTRTDLTVDVVTKDHWNVRVKPMAITDRRLPTAKQQGHPADHAQVVSADDPQQSIHQALDG